MIVEPIVASVKVGTKMVSIFQPEEKALKLWYANNTASVDFPYWGKIWPASAALAQYIIENKSIFLEKNVVEIGAGLGLPSLVAAEFSKHVYCTDYLHEPLAYVAASAGLQNLQNVETGIYDFTNISSFPEADIVLLSDLNYAPEYFEAIENMIKHYLHCKAHVIVAMPQRVSSHFFIDKIMHIIDSTDSHIIDTENSRTIIYCFPST